MKKHYSKLLLIILTPLLTISLILVGMGKVQAFDANPALQKVIEAANKEGSLTLSWSTSTLGGSKGAKLFETALNKMFGTNIRIKFSPGPSFGRIGNQIATELKAGQKSLTDTYLATAAQITPLIKRDIFTTVPWPKLLPGRITDEITDADNRALKLATGLTGATYNSKLVPMKPKSLEDFLKPEWKGKVSSTPYAAGFDVLAADGVWGGEKTIAYVKKLSGQLAGLMRCAEAERLTTGEYASLVMNCTGQFALVWKAKGVPLERIIPRDAAMFRYYYLTVPKNAEHPNAAKLFTTFMMTEEAQKLQWQVAKLDLHLFPQSVSGPEIRALKNEGVKFTHVSIAWWEKHPEIAKVKREVIKILTKKK